MTSPHEQALAAAVREHDREEAAMRGEPDPWGDGQPEPAGDEWNDRIACMELAIAAYLASLPADVDGLMLKPLEWKQTNDAIGEEAFVASTPVGEYLATEAGLYFHVSDATSGDLLLATNGTSEAKTAAFADYSRRILPAIDTSALSAKLAAVERERDATQELLTDLADTFERFLGDLGHPQDSWQRDQIARARKETPDAQ